MDAHRPVGERGGGLMGTPKPTTAAERARKSLVHFAYEMRKPDTLLTEEANLLDYLLDGYRREARQQALERVRARLLLMAETPFVPGHAADGYKLAVRDVLHWVEEASHDR